MFFALDKDNNRVDAEDGTFSGCVCPACGAPVIQKQGDYKAHHFAHKRKVDICPFEDNEDYKNMSEWHRRMQEYFPKDNRERILEDEKTGKKYIADVYLEKSNTVIEFQYSPIKKQVFLERTYFHLTKGRRIAWVFDESWKEKDENSYSKLYYKNGKLQKFSDGRLAGPYSTREFKWLYRRKCVGDGPEVYQEDYSVCVYTGAIGDVFHRIIDLDESIILVSLHNITMTNEIDIEEFFYPESHWQEQEPWKSQFESLENKTESSRSPHTQEWKIDKRRNEKVISDTIQPLNSNSSQAYYRADASFDDKKFLDEIQEKVRKYNEEKEKLDHEDYWRALLAFVDRQIT